jgi:multiple sugar transport system substrate-binding protein/putative spermidine/putrescine transport system substrate-binding protein
MKTTPASRLRAAAALLLSACVGGLALAQAQPPKPGFDAATLTRQNFHQVLEPAARREGKLVFYNFAGNFDPVWKNGLIPRFEARYGVKVEYHNVRKDQAIQQLAAVQKAGKPSPVDVFFAGGPDNFMAMAPMLAAYPLADLLPNLQAVPDAYKRIVFGIDAQGRWPIVHRSQLVLGYDSALLPAGQLPNSFESLLAWAEHHPRKLAITSPHKGGSGGAFLYSAAQHLVQDAACRKTMADAAQSQAQAEAWAMKAACLEPLWTYQMRLLKVAELTNGNADTLNLLNNRKALIGTMWEDHALTFVRSKLLPETFRVTSLTAGLAAGGDGIVVAAQARSPAAALLFVDMAFGREFQAWKMEHHASRSPRGDVGPASVSPQTAVYLLPPEQAQTRSITINWTVARALALAFEEKVLSRR